MPIVSDLQYHTKLKGGDLGKYVLLPGDPQRVDLIAKYFDNPEFVADSREHRSFRGTLLGERVGVISTGMGCASTAIAMEELIAIGCETFIRVGTSGALQEGAQTGDVAIVTAAIRDEGTTREYMPIEYPAIAHIDVVNALIRGAKNTGQRYCAGITHSKDSLYAEIAPETMPLCDELKMRMHAWKAGGAVCSEMEAAAIFIISSIYRKRAGGAMLMYGDDFGKVKPDISLVINIAVDGLKEIIRQDRQTGV